VDVTVASAGIWQKEAIQLPAWVATTPNAFETAILHGDLGSRRAGCGPRSGHYSGIHCAGDRFDHGPSK
jgi:hypothetical protein